MFVTKTEGKVNVLVPKETDISRKLPVFYNEKMQYNRDITVLLLNCIEQKRPWQLGFPLSGTGVRAIRITKECPKLKIKAMQLNDNNPKAIDIIKKNFESNNLNIESRSSTLDVAGDEEGTHCFQQDANLFLMGSKGFDYIDIDPYGPPTPFLAAAMQRISRGGILAVTATDTAALCGTSPLACKRKYFADPVRSTIQHETGLRILIRRVQLEGASIGKACTPMLSYYRDHYMRVFFKISKSRQAADDIVKQHGWIIVDNKNQDFTTIKNVSNFKERSEHSGQLCGPMWLGKLGDQQLANKMLSKCKTLNFDTTDTNYTNDMLAEQDSDIVGFYETTKLARICKIIELVKQEKILEALRKKKHLATKTMFCGAGIKTSASSKEIKEVLCRLTKQHN